MLSPGMANKLEIGLGLICQSLPLKLSMSKTNLWLSMPLAEISGFSWQIVRGLVSPILNWNTIQSTTSRLKTTSALISTTTEQSAANLQTEMLQGSAIY